VGTLQPFTAKDSGWSGTFPAGVPDGTYWVGWIIDSDLVIDEFDETNNTAYKAAYQLEVLASQPPRLGAVTPNSGSSAVGDVVYFTTVWKDPDGYDDLRKCEFQIGETRAAPGNVRLFYDPLANLLKIRNNDGTKWWGWKTPGSATTMANAQAIVHCGDTTVVKSGNQIEVTWAVEFKPGFEGAKKLFLRAYDTSGLGIGFKNRGTWTVE
jgi:hypothetical protein